MAVGEEWGVGESPEQRQETSLVLTGQVHSPKLTLLVKFLLFCVLVSAATR